MNRKSFLKATLGVGTGVLLVPSDANLALATGIVRSRLRTSDGFRMLSEIAGLAAWLAADRGDNAIARRRYAEAISHADRTHHPLLVAYMTASLGHFAVEAGDVNQGLNLLQQSRRQLDAGTSQTARAWLASLLAVACASAGDRKQTLTELRQAEKLVAHQQDEPQWPWVFTFCSAKAAQYRASALGRLGDLRAASTAYTTAGPALTAAKPRALAQVEHARVLAGMGDITGGCALATEALSIGRAYGSERITSRAREFRSSLPVHTAEARQLDEALAALSVETRRMSRKGHSGR